MAYTTHIQAVMGDGNAHCGNIIGSFNNTVHRSDEDAQIMRWLSPLEPHNRHQGVRNDRFDGVGDWILETNEFRRWRGSEGGADQAVLFFSGKPGVGKTYLSSLVIDSLCDQARKEDIAVAGLYCDFLAQQDQTIANMMGAILKQLVGRGGTPQYLRDAFHKGKGELGGRGLRLPDLARMLKATIASLSQVFICIDALYEYMPKHLPELLELLRDIVRESPKTRIFLTGRPHVKEDIQRYFSKTVVMPISPNKDDVRNYLEMRLSRDPEPEAMNHDLKGEIMRITLERASDIFLLVSLSIDAILGEVTIRQRRKKLEEMTQGNGLSDAYTATLARLKAQKGNRSILGLRVLMWVVYSERPLRVEELCHALGVEVGSADLDVENIPALRTLLASSLGLVTVEASSSTIRLMHYTLQEHLLGDPTLFPSPHSTIAEVCLTYLNFGSIRDLSPTLYWAPPTTPLLDYASSYWGEHTRKGMTENVKTLALRLLERFEEHICAQLILLRHNEDKRSGPYFYGMRGPAGFTGLHGVAFLGIAGIAAAVLEMTEWDINAIDSTGCAAITWAAMRGHEEMVRVLLEREDVNPNTADSDNGWTPLLWAAEGGHEGVVRMLLEREDVSPEAAGVGSGRTPLLLAAEHGHPGVVMMLLDRQDVNPNTADTDYDQTPLAWAAEHGHEGIVKMLLERQDVNPDTPDTRYGRTPLSWAADNGYEGIVRMLLERQDVNPDTADTECGRTPLSWAAEHGYEGIVKMLLERPDVNPDTADVEYDRTPLSWAVEQGHGGVVKVLLERPDVNPNTVVTEYGHTPLLHAVMQGEVGIVGMLLERKDANPNTAETEYGMTPLVSAVSHGNVRVVRMLLEREDVDPNMADTDNGRTPLCWAAEQGHGWLAKMLLERQDINPNIGDDVSGRTPLMHAIVGGHMGIVGMLLEREDINPNTADNEYGRTPLLWADEEGHEGIVKTLLERGDVDPNIADTEYGMTLLSWQALRGREAWVKILLERGDVNLNTTDSEFGRTPLSWAAERGHEGVVKMLLEREGVSTTTLDNKDQTPLSLALSKGHNGVARILRERGSADFDTADFGGRASPPQSAFHDECMLEMQY